MSRNSGPVKFGKSFGGLRFFILFAALFVLTLSKPDLIYARIDSRLSGDFRLRGVPPKGCKTYIRIISNNEGNSISFFGLDKIGDKPEFLTQKNVIEASWKPLDATLFRRGGVIFRFLRGIVAFDYGVVLPFIPVTEREQIRLGYLNKDKLIWKTHHRIFFLFPWETSQKLIYERIQPSNSSTLGGSSHETTEEIESHSALTRGF